MKKGTRMVTPETIDKLIKCFESTEEVTVFLEQMKTLSDELIFNFSLMQRVDDLSSFNVCTKIICLFSLFCRENVEIVRQLISNIEFKELTEEDMKKLKGD